MNPVDAGHFTSFQLRDSAVQGRDMHLVRLVVGSRELYGSSPARERILRMIRGALLAGDAALREACTVRVRVHPPHAGYRGDHIPAGHDDPALRVEVELEPSRRPPAEALRVRSHVGLRQAPGVKHLALDFQHEARRTAREAGFDDALLLAPDGCISEGTFWNVVFRDGTGWVWPAAPALAGVTRSIMQMEMDRRGVVRRDAPVGLADLGAMRAAFAINSTGVAGLAGVDDHRFPGDPAAAATLRDLLAAVPWDPL